MITQTTKGLNDFEGFKDINDLKGIKINAKKGNTMAVGLLMQANVQQARAANALPPRQATRPSKVKNAHRSSFRDAIHATASIRCGCKAQKRTRSKELFNKKCSLGIIEVLDILESLESLENLDCITIEETRCNKIRLFAI